MATLDTRYPTLATFAQRMGQDGKIIQDTVEILSETNEILEDMVFVEANGVTDHSTTVRSGLPQVAWKRLYKGVQPSRSEVTKVKDSMGILIARALVDEELLNLNNNSAGWLASEEKPFVEAMSQEMAHTIWYEDGIKNPERFMGLSPRYSDKKAENGRNILDAGGKGNTNASIWLIVWGQNTCHGIYPKGSKAGLEKTDMGITTVSDDEGGRYEAHETKHRWAAGLSLRDWRFVVRIANIDVTQLKKDMSTGANLPDLMADALELVPNLNGRAAFYMNRELRRILRGQINHTAKYTISQEQVGGKRVTKFGDGDGVPVRVSDALRSDEPTVK